MQIKTNWKKKNHYLIWQKNILTIIINCISILVLSAIIVVTPSLSSSQSSQTNSSSTVITTAQHNMVKLLADMVRNKLHDAVNLLEITSKDPVIQNVSFENFITKKYMGIPSTMDLPKRKLAQDILVRDKDFGNVYFVTPKADVYIGEPFSDQRQLPRLNYADRDWYKGVTATNNNNNNNTYIGAVFMSASIHVPAT